MKICIIGWYGTETIGDRAILMGILYFLRQSVNDFSITLGSLYPFFTERTLLEDYELYKSILGADISINLFNSKNISELNRAIKRADILIMGGGPLMHIGPLYMIDYAFRRARKFKKKTIIYGCGIGPIFKKRFKKVLVSIINHSDLIILRDSVSKKNLEDIFNELHCKLKNDVFISSDPAVECCLKYLELESENKSNSKKNYISINLREFPSEYSKISKKICIDKFLEDFIIKIAYQFSENDIVLVPMHYFVIGSDDRSFMNRIVTKNDLKNVYVQNKPLTLRGTMDIFRDAYMNIGMRFHSVVFQTLLNGKNYILDYTEPNIGKISGFINDIDKNEFYKNRYVNLNIINNDISLKNIEFDRMKFEYNVDEINKQLEVYKKGLIE